MGWTRFGVAGWAYILYNILLCETEGWQDTAQQQSVRFQLHAEHRHSRLEHLPFRYYYVNLLGAVDQTILNVMYSLLVCQRDRVHARLLLCGQSRVQEKGMCSLELLGQGVP